MGLLLTCLIVGAVVLYPPVRRVIFDGDDSDRVVRDLENELKRGGYGFPPPVLNGVAT